MTPEKVILTADIIIAYTDGSIILVKRKNDPFKGQWALPGGLMDQGETIQQAAIREAKEETGLDIELVKIIGVYSAPERDPRGRYISVAFLATAIGGEMKAADDAADIQRTANYTDLLLAFDHDQILSDYRRSM